MPSSNGKQDIEAMATQARRMIRAADRASLATALRKQPDAPADKGWPYVSFVLSACDHDGAPLLLLSDLADHSRNIRDDNRVSLLFSHEGEPGNNREEGPMKTGTEENSQMDPLSRPRLSLLGRLKEDPDPHSRECFLARHPASAKYAGFGDFRIYRLHPLRGRLVAEFGRVAWIEADHLLYGGGNAANCENAKPPSASI